jgi:hypothetical protein
MSKKNFVLAFIFLIFISLILLNISFSSVDFGQYADDIRRVDQFSIFLETKRTLPKMYDYPSFVFLVSFFSSLFYHWSEFKLIGLGDFIHFVSSDSTSTNYKNFVAPISYNEILFIRKVFVSLCILNIFFIFFSLKSLKLHSISCFFGSLIIPLSFHFWSRSRLIAADALLVTFASAVLYFAIKFSKTKKLNYLYFCTLFCAFAASCKYTGGILILIPILLLFLNRSIFKFVFIKKIFTLIFFFIISFVLLNPGIIAEPVKFFEDIYLVRNIYVKMGYGFFHIEAGFTHLVKLFEFLFLKLTSDYEFISIVILVTSIFGLIFFTGESSNTRKYFKLKIVFIFIPIVYLIYFSTHVVMTVNNHLFYLPFIAIFFSMGIDLLIKKKLSKIYKTFIILFLVTIFSFNFYNIISARNSLKFNSNEIISQELKNYLIQNNNKKIVINSNVRKFLSEEDKKNLKLIDINDVYKFDFLLYVLPDYAFYFLTVEKKYYGQLANNIDQYMTVAGPRDMDINYIPTWVGYERIIKVSAQNFEKNLRNFDGGNNFKYYSWQ